MQSTHTRVNLKDKKSGITLISLVVTIIILLILAGISIGLISGSNGILGRASEAVDTNDQTTATEKMEMKITYLNMISYGENTRKANLQELAEGMFQDKEVDYVKIKEQKVASLEMINVTGENSIFVKLKEYPYEFEIGSDLQLASVDGVKVEKDSDEISSLKAEISQMKSEMNEMKNTVSLLQNNNLGKIHLIRREWAVSQVEIPKDKWTVLETISLAGYGSGKAIISYSASTASTVSTKFEIDLHLSGAGTIGMAGIPGVWESSWLRVSTSATINYDETTEIQMCANAQPTLSPYYTYSILLIPEE